MSAVADIAVGLGALYDMEEIDSVAPGVFALEMRPVEGACTLMPFHLRFGAGGGCRRLRMSRWVLMPSVIWKGTDPVVPEVFFLDMKKSIKACVFWCSFITLFWCQRRVSAVADIAVGFGCFV